MKWISVEDRLPGFNVKVLAHDTQMSYIALRKPEEEYNEHWNICENSCCSCNGCTGSIRHWMPLPLIVDKEEDKENCSTCGDYIFNGIHEQVDYCECKY